eukprot:228298-Karenia_brevis.AAC.1
MYRIADIQEAAQQPHPPASPAPATQLRATRPRRQGALRLRPQDTSPGPQGLMSLRDMLLAAGYQ